MKSPEILNSFRTSSNFRRKCFARQTILEEKCFAHQTILGKKCFARQTILEAEVKIQAQTPPNASHFAQESLR